MDQDAIATLISTQYPGLLSLLRRKLRDEQLAQDVLNNALVTALEHLQAGRVANPGLIAGYVFQVAMNQLRNHRRKMDERTNNRVDPDVVDALADPDASIDAAFEPAIANRVRALVQSLATPRDREIVRRFYLHEEEKDAICRDLGLSSLHFDKVVFRARQRMKALLEGEGLRRQDFFSLLLVCAA